MKKLLLLPKDTHFYILLIAGIASGIIASFICILYHFLLRHAERFIYYTSITYNKNPLYILGLFLFLTSIAFCVSKCIKKEPYICEGGAQQIELELEDKIQESWWRVILYKMLAGTLCILSGMSLSREGPSIQLGGMCAKGVSELFNFTQHERHFLIICGASAGLSAAFNAPLAGIVFALQQLYSHHNKNHPFSILNIFTVVFCALIGDFFTQYVFSLSTIIRFPTIIPLPFDSYWYIVILAILCACVAYLFKKVTFIIQNIYKKLTFLKTHQYVFIATLFSFFSLLFIPRIGGGGMHLLDLLQHKIALSTLVILFIAKFIFTIICFSSKAPGGLFFPIITLGGYIGVAFIIVANTFFNLDMIHTATFAIIAMAGLLSGIVKSPFASILIIIEMTNSIQLLPSIVIIVLLVTYFTNMLHKIKKSA